MKIAVSEWAADNARENAKRLAGPRRVTWGVGVSLVGQTRWFGQGAPPAGLTPCGYRRWAVPAGTEVLWSESPYGSRQFRKSTARPGLVLLGVGGRTGSGASRMRLKLLIPAGYGVL